MNGAIKRIVTGLALSVLLSGCAVYLTQQFDERYGTAQPRDRLVQADSTEAQLYSQHIQPILEHRCVVCHACYDAPCQLKLNSPEGIDRGINHDKVYNATRILASPPARLFQDALSTSEWRKNGFEAVLNERDQTASNNLSASLLYQTLKLKADHPSPSTGVLPDSFDFSLDRRGQQCSSVETYDRFTQRYPLWGMPYGLPGLNETELSRMRSWLEQGALMPLAIPLTVDLTQKVALWEQWFNQDAFKNRLVTRYIYEHLYLFSLYFEEIDASRYFKLVRSKTAPGQPIEPIASRRPYDDPQVERVYYRLQLQRETPVAKTHSPYSLSPARMQRWQALFLDDPFQVDALPGYDTEISANPFIVFSAIPSGLRYRFMLDEARTTISAFIKGPVCRGQVAVNVINDHFWVFFTNPDRHSAKASAFLSKNADLLAPPVDQSSNTLPVSSWIQYARKEAKFLEAKSKILNDSLNDNLKIDEQLIWDGEGTNDNAALTIFRHFDNATVVKGLVGESPKTAWVIDYSLLERIHYLLVAGFDVYGNLGHQLITRLYMDFLRMEGEFNFLAFLPSQTRASERDHWYRDSGVSIRDYVYGQHTELHREPSIDYQTQQPKLELYQKLNTHLGPLSNHQHELEHTALSSQAIRLMKQSEQQQSSSFALLPSVTLLLVTTLNGDDELLSLIHNQAHANISSLFNETKSRLPEEDSVTWVRGVLGDYPNAFMRIDEADLPDLVSKISTMKDETDYSLLMDAYGVRRSAPDFWKNSDAVLTLYRKKYPDTAAVLDYNRLENR